MCYNLKSKPTLILHAIPFSSGPSPPASCLHYSPTSKQLKTLPRGNFWSDSGPLRVEVLKNFLKAYSAILFGLHKTWWGGGSWWGGGQNRGCVWGKWGAQGWAWKRDRGDWWGLGEGTVEGEARAMPGECPVSPWVAWQSQPRPPCSRLRPQFRRTRDESNGFGVSWPPSIGAATLLPHHPPDPEEKPWPLGTQLSSRIVPNATFKTG